MKEEKLATESKDEKRLAKTKSGKPFYKKAWFWVVVIIGGLFASNFIYGVIRSISNAYVPIPDVKGLTKKEACEKIEKAGFICKTGYNYDPSDEKQKVSDFNVHSKTDFDDLRNGQFNSNFENKRSMRAKRGSAIEIKFELSEKQKSEREKREAEYKAKQQKDNTDMAEKEKANKVKKDAEDKKKQQNQPQPHHQTQPQSPQPSEGETLPKSVLPEDIAALCERDIENIGFKRANIKVTNHYAMGFPKYTYVIVGELSKKEKLFGHREVVGTVQCQANWNNWSVIAVRINGDQIK